MIKITIHPGHTAENGGAPGGHGILNESDVNREIVSALSAYLNGQSSVQCVAQQVDTADNARDCLKKLCAMANNADADFNISIHTNIGRKDRGGDGKLGGCEIFIYNNASDKVALANNILSNLKKIGLPLRSDATSPRDGIKINPGFYILKHTTKPTLLVEVFFLDDKDDINLYNKIGAIGIAKAIGDGIINYAKGIVADNNNNQAGSDSEEIDNSTNDFISALSNIKMLANNIADIVDNSL